MPYTAHQYEIDRSFDVGVINGGVSPTGRPGMRAYVIPLTGWDDTSAGNLKAHDPRNLRDDVSGYYDRGELGYTPDRYAIDQGPLMLVTQSVVPTEDTERPKGVTDPAAAGLSQSDILMESIHYRRASGSDSTQFLDAPGVTRTPYGRQDGASWTYLQDSALGLAEYGDKPLSPISPDPSAPFTMPDTMRALPPQPSGGWTSVPVRSIGQEILTGWADNASQSQQATAQEFTANSANAGSTLLTRMRHAGQSQSAGVVGGTPGARWNRRM